MSRNCIGRENESFEAEFRLVALDVDREPLGAGVAALNEPTQLCIIQKPWRYKIVLGKEIV